MPFADFSPSDAGSRVNHQILGNIDFGASMMERATRNAAMLQDIEQRKQRFVTDQLLSDQQLQMNRQKLAEWEGEQKVREAQNRANVAVSDGKYSAATTAAQTLELNSKLLKSASDELPGVLATLDNASNPHELKIAAATFHGRYGHLAKDPQLGEQYAAIEGQVAGKLAARSEEYLSKIEAATTALMPAVDPTNPEAMARVRNSPFFSIARLDPTFAQTFDAAQKVIAEHAYKQAEQGQKVEGEIKVKQTAEGTKEADKTRELTVPGYEGRAPALEEAKKFRELTAATDKAESSIGRLLAIANTPGKSVSPQLRAEASTEANVLKGALRVEIVGPGAVSESEHKLLDAIIANPTKLFSLDSQNKQALNTLLTRLKTNREIVASGLGLKRTAGSPSTETPVTGGNDLQARINEARKRGLLR